MKVGWDKYCSKKCQNISQLGSLGHWLGKKRPDLVNTKANKTMFKKGLVPWNKGMVSRLKGVKEKEEPKYLKKKDKDCPICGKKIMRMARTCKSCWQNNKTKSPQLVIPKYYATHVWVNKHFENIPCERCGAMNIRLEWANISGEYSRDRDDWLHLCRKCHKDFDKVDVESFYTEVASA